MNNPISVEYTDYELRNLVEEYITQQKSEFTLKGACSYIIYWAIEDGKFVDGQKLIESIDLHPNDQNRVKQLLQIIVNDGRIKSLAGDETKYEIMKH